jgi:hypothetical protein
MATTLFTDLITLVSASWLNQIDTQSYHYLTSVTGTNTIAGTGPASLTAYAAGQKFSFLPANDNTGATTINITQSGAAALGAKNVFAGGAACVGGEIQAGIPCTVQYDGTQFHLVGPMVGGLIPGPVTLVTPALGTPASGNPSNLTGGMGTAWTPSVTSQSGTITTVGAVSGSYSKVGKLIVARFSVVITTKGTGAGSMNITGLPANAAVQTAGYGIDQTTGKALVVSINVGTISVSLYDGTTIITDGEIVQGVVVYETA